MVTRELYDTWKVQPPCEYGDGCDSSCPYYVDCWGDENTADEDNDELA